MKNVSSLQRKKKENQLIASEFFIMHDIDFSETNKSKVSAQTKHESDLLGSFETIDFSSSRIARDHVIELPSIGQVDYCQSPISIEFEQMDLHTSISCILHRNSLLNHFTEHYWLSISRLYFSNFARVCLCAEHNFPVVSRYSVWNDQQIKAKLYRN